jgi:hypothetical protein
MPIAILGSRLLFVISLGNCLTRHDELISPAKERRENRNSYDRLLGTHYAKEVGHNARLNAAKRRGDAVMDFFVTFSNVVGVPMMLAGTPKALSLFETSFRLATVRTTLRCCMAKQVCRSWLRADWR